MSDDGFRGRFLSRGKVEPAPPLPAGKGNNSHFFKTLCFGSLLTFLLSLTPIPLFAVPGDFNNDGIVDKNDLGFLRSVFHTEAPDSDLNGDSRIDFEDASLFGLNYGNTEPWSSDILIENTDSAIIGETSYPSSSRLRAIWNLPVYPLASIRITATDLVSGNSIVLDTGGTETFALLAGLKSATAYAVRLTGFRTNEETSVVAASDSATGVTGEEVWQIQGTSRGYLNAHKVVPDGDRNPTVIVYGASAGGGLAGKARLYYSPDTGSDWGGSGARAAEQDTITIVSDTSTVFDTRNAGFKQMCDPLDTESCAPGSLVLQSFQTVPISSPPSIRVFFEAWTSDDTAQISRLYRIDSLDGYSGLDFDSDPSSSVCGGLATFDYLPGEDCELGVVLGTQTDTAAGNTGLLSAGDFSIGFPVLDSWTWDGISRIFMVVNGKDACGNTGNGLFFASFDGINWTVDRDTVGCASVLVDNAEDPEVVHLGSGRYKLYFEDASGGGTGKPLRILYADAGRSGDPDNVGLTDWENSNTARDVTFLWPDGSPLGQEDESGLGDHSVFFPDNSPESQFMYLNLGGFDNVNWNAGAAGIGVARLVNP